MLYGIDVPKVLNFFILSLERSISTRALAISDVLRASDCVMCFLLLKKEALQF